MTVVAPWLWWGGFPLAFVLTWVIETPGYVAAFAALGWWRRGSASSPLSLGRCIGIATGANVITHPLVWAALQPPASTPVAIAAELGAVLAEGLLVFFVVRRSDRVRDSRGSCLAWSVGTALGVNTLSVLIGLVVLPLLLSAGSSASG